MENVKFTVLGGTGFIGSRLVTALRAQGARVYVPSREDVGSGNIGSEDLGHVVYAVGLTSDFRTRLSDTVQAHVCLMDRLLNSTRWTSWLFLSSTRVYGTQDTGFPHSEHQPVLVSPNADSVYDLSKLLGEALVLSRKEDQCRVARLSNVFGLGMSQDTFLASLAAMAHASGKVVVRESSMSAKDYISIDRVLEYLPQISLNGEHRVYNVASGSLLEHRTIGNLIKRVFSAQVRYQDDGLKRRLPQIDVSRLRTEFGGDSMDVESEIESMLCAMRA